VHICNKLTLSSESDAINNFVRIDITETSLGCKFIDQSKEYKKFCAIEYGPETPGCQNLTFSSSPADHEGDSGDINIQLDPPVTNNNCFIVSAGNSTNTIKVQGIYRSSGKAHNN
jgi:hypothetical protein